MCGAGHTVSENWGDKNSLILASKNMHCHLLRNFEHLKSHRCHFESGRADADALQTNVMTRDGFLWNLLKVLRSLTADKHWKEIWSDHKSQFYDTKLARLAVKLDLFNVTLRSSVKTEKYTAAFLDIPGDVNLQWVWFVSPGLWSGRSFICWALSCSQFTFGQYCA